MGLGGWSLQWSAEGRSVGGNTLWGHVSVLGCDVTSGLPNSERRWRSWESCSNWAVKRLQIRPEGIQKDLIKARSMNSTRKVVTWTQRRFMRLNLRTAIRRRSRRTIHHLVRIITPNQNDRMTTYREVQYLRISGISSKLHNRNQECKGHKAPASSEKRADFPQSLWLWRYASGESTWLSVYLVILPPTASLDWWFYRVGASRGILSRSLHCSFDVRDWKPPRHCQNNWLVFFLLRWLFKCDNYCTENIYFTGDAENDRVQRTTWTCFYFVITFVPETSFSGDTNDEFRLQGMGTFWPSGRTLLIRWFKLQSEHVKNVFDFQISLLLVSPEVNFMTCPFVFRGYTQHF